MGVGKKLSGIDPNPGHSGPYPQNAAAATFDSNLAKQTQRETLLIGTINIKT